MIILILLILVFPFYIINSEAEELSTPLLSDPGTGDLSIGATASEDPEYNGTNDYDPVVLLNEPTIFNISNDGWQLIVFNITIIDQDDPPNGSHIEGATISLGVFGGGVTDFDMEYWPMSGDNTSRKTGRWIFNWTTPTAPELTPGDYDLVVNVTDSGNITDAGSFKRWNMYPFSMSVHQYNRPTTAGSAGTLNIDEDNVTAAFDLMGIFNDADIDNAPIPKTDPDSYTFSMWDGTGYVNNFNFGNFNILVDAGTGSVTFVPDDNWFNVDASDITGDTVMFYAEDSLGWGANNNVTFKVMSVNDAPKLHDPATWERGPNVEYMYMFGYHYFIIQEDREFYVKVNATDNDTADPMPDYLSFDMDASYSFFPIPADLGIDANTGEITWTPDNDDAVEEFYMINITVMDDDGEVDWLEASIIIENTNDDPYFTKIRVEGVTGAVDIIDHTPILSGDNAATQDELFEFTVYANDDDVEIDDELAFKIGSGPPSLKKVDEGSSDSKCKFSVTPTNDDALVGYVLANISIRDTTGVSIDDHVEIKIHVQNVNDAPEITMIDGKKPPEDRVIDRGEIKRSYYDNFTVMANDIDLDELNCKSDPDHVDIELIDDNEWAISFNPSQASSSNDLTITISVSDGILEDKISIKWNILDEVVEQPPSSDNQEPEIEVNTENNNKWTYGDEIIIVGTWNDDDTDGNITLQVEIVMPGQAPTGDFVDVPSGSTGGFGGNGWVIINEDGTWVYRFDTSMLEDMEAWGDSHGIDLGNGNYNFFFRVVDDSGSESEADNFIVVLDDEKEPKPKDDPLSVGMFAYDIIVVILVTLTIIAIIIFLFIAYRRPTTQVKSHKYIEERQEVEGSKLRCRSCGSVIDEDNDTCPWCGSEAPIPIKAYCDCGRPLYEGMIRCQGCGKLVAIQEPENASSEGYGKACNNCGTELLPDSDQCNTCGTPTGEPE